MGGGGLDLEKREGTRQTFSATFPLFFDLQHPLVRSPRFLTPQLSSLIFVTEASHFKMGLSIWNLYKSSLLLINSLLILNRRRFLAKHGLDPNSPAPVNAYGVAEISPIKTQARGLLAAIEYLRVPVIALNTLTVLFELVLGGA